MAMKKTEVRSQVNIQCKLCGAEITFDVNDTSSFLSKTEHQNFFGTTLVTYRVQHVMNKEIHLNAILLDDQNLFRGYIDAYKMPVLQKEEEVGFVDFSNFLLLENEVTPMPENEVFSNFFVVNLKGWILEVIKTSSLKTKTFLQNIFKKFIESKAIYENIPQPLNVAIADLECFLWTEGKTFIILSTSHKQSLDYLSKTMSQLVKAIEANILIPKKRIFTFLVAILLETDLAEKRPDIILRLLTDDLFYSKIMIRYPDRLKEIIPKVVERFAVPKKVLEELLLGKISLISLLEEQPGLIKQSRALIEALDFTNRRKLLV